MRSSRPREAGPCDSGAAAEARLVYGEPRNGRLNEAGPWPAQRGRPATGSGRRGQTRPRRGEAGPWSAWGEAASGREALLLRLVGVGRWGATGRACGGRRRGRNGRAWGCARGRRSDRADEEGDATQRVCGGRAWARRGSLLCFCVCCWRRQCLGRMTLCCALPKSLNEYHVWVVLVGDSLSPKNFAKFFIFPVTSNFRRMHRVLNIDENKN